MRKYLIASMIMAMVAGLFMPAMAEPAPMPQYSRHGDRSKTEVVDAYYYDYVRKEIAFLKIQVSRKKIVEYWDNNTWVACSVRAKSNKEGDTSKDIPEDWKKLSKDFEYTAELNYVKLFFNHSENGYF